MILIDGEFRVFGFYYNKSSLLICTDDGDLLLHRLGYQQADERVSVVKWELNQERGMFRLDSQYIKPILHYPALHKVVVVGVKI